MFRRWLSAHILLQAILTKPSPKAVQRTGGRHGQALSIDLFRDPAYIRMQGIGQEIILQGINLLVVDA